MKDLLKDVAIKKHNVVSAYQVESHGLSLSWDAGAQTQTHTPTTKEMYTF